MQQQISSESSRLSVWIKRGISWDWEDWVSYLYLGSQHSKLRPMNPNSPLQVLDWRIYEKGTLRLRGFSVTEKRKEGVVFHEAWLLDYHITRICFKAYMHLELLLDWKRDWKAKGGSREREEVGIRDCCSDC
jgi:hypothetical protein